MGYLNRFAKWFGVTNYLPLKYVIDLLLWAVAGPLAFVVRLEEGYVRYSSAMLLYGLASIPLKAIAIYTFSLQRQSWHKIGIRDLHTLLKAIGSASLLFELVALAIGPFLRIPRSIPLLDGGLALLMIGVTRLVARTLYEQDLRTEATSPASRVLIVGAGDAGTMLAHEMIRRPDVGMYPVGYLDDERSKVKQKFFGVSVLGTVDQLPVIVNRLEVDEVLIAMPTASGQVVRHVVSLAQEVGVRFRIIPGMYEILSGKVSISQIRDVALDDLLRRDPVRLDPEDIAGYLEGCVVMVTGAAGSIGSEIVRQVAHFAPKQLLLLDREENNLYLLERELVQQHPNIDFHTLVADILQRKKLDSIFHKYHPTVIFHAAAYKHVPMMESNPDEAILNNVGGTKNLVEIALRHDVERFVNISTDKAVKPSSVMGASKRVAEYLVRQASRQAKQGQRFVSVRFGNVLGSRGSVVPIFNEQIRRGGPVTVTHPEMKRYFMSIPEAAQLVLQAGSMKDNHTVYILDMGEPVKIADLARDMIRLSGFEPDIDIAIQYTQPRPGEKLFEELATPKEELDHTRHPKIFVARHNGDRVEDLDQQVEALLAAAQSADMGAVCRFLTELIPDYSPNGH